MPERHADPGEQLAGAERLGDVVVGAGVERRDLVPLLAPRREDDDRNGRPLAQPADHVEAVHVGQAEIEDDDVGLARAGLDDALRARRRLEEPVAVALERGAEEAPDLRLVLDEDDRPASGVIAPAPGTGGSAVYSVERQREAERRRRLRAVLRPDATAVRLRRSRGRSASPSPRLACRPGPPGRTSRTRAPPRPVGSPGPRSATSTRQTLPSVAVRDDVDGAVRRACTSIALSRRLTSTCSISTSSIGTSGRSARDADVTRGAEPRLLGAAPARPRRPPRAGCHSLCELEGAGLEPRHVEQVVDQPVQALGLVADRLQQVRARPLIQARSGLEERRRGAGDGGERRAKVVRHRAQERVAEPLGLDAHLRGLRLLGERRALDGERGLVREGLERWSCSGLLEDVRSAEA